jgi:hypothetical protein
MGEAHSDVKVENTGSEPSQAYTGQAPASEGEPSPFPYSHENHLPRLDVRIGTFRTLRRHLTLPDEEAVAVPDEEVCSAPRSDSGAVEATGMALAPDRRPGARSSVTVTGIAAMTAIASERCRSALRPCPPARHLRTAGCLVNEALICLPGPA